MTLGIHGLITDEATPSVNGSKNKYFPHLPYFFERSLHGNIQIDRENKICKKDMIKETDN
jgi:hypothetical protein